MSEEAKQRARQRARKAIAEAKGFYWQPSPKKDDNHQESVEPQATQWKKPVKIPDDLWRLNCHHFRLSVPHAKQRNVSLTGAHIGTHAHVPAEPKKRKPDNPSGP